MGVFVFGMISALVTAVFAFSLEYAPESSLSRLKLIHRAAAIYRLEAGGRWPSQETVYEAYLGLTQEFFISPCANHTGYVERELGVSYRYMWSEGRDPFFEDPSVAAPLFIDLDCNVPGNEKKGAPMLGLGVTAGGEAIRLEKPGDPSKWSWWVAPEAP